MSVVDNQSLLTVVIIINRKYVIDKSYTYTHTHTHTHIHIHIHIYIIVF